MDQKSKLILREKEMYLRSNLPIDQILHRLYQSHLISDRDRQQIQKEATSMDRVTVCLRIIKQKKDGYTKFLKVLEEEECGFIVEELESTVIPEEYLSTERPRDDVRTSAINATEPSTGGVEVTLGLQSTVRTYRNRNRTTHTMLPEAGDAYNTTFSHEDWNVSRCRSDAQSTTDDTRAKVLSIFDLSTYKSCINPECFRVGLYRNRCESCGFYYNYRIQSGTSAKGKIKLQMKGNTEYFTIFTQQLEQLCDITGVEMNLLNIRTVQMQLNRRMPITVKCYTRGKKVSSFHAL